MINRDRLLDRFLRYVAIHTTSDPDADCYPSSAGQWELGKMLLKEVNALKMLTSEAKKPITCIVGGSKIWGFKICDKKICDKK